MSFFRTGAMVGPLKAQWQTGQLDAENLHLLPVAVVCLIGWVTIDIFSLACILDASLDYYTETLKRSRQSKHKALHIE